MKTESLVCLNDVIVSANTGLDAIKRAPIVDYDSGIRCLRIQDISQDKDFDNWGFCKVENKNFDKFQLKENDIIIARTGATIGVNRFIRSKLDAVYNNGLIRIRINEKVANPKYIYYCMQSQKYRDFINSICAGTSTQPNMKINAFLNFDFILPSIEIQRNIVNVLGAFDDKIENNNAINDNLQQQAQALYHERFESMSFDELPSSWRVVNLGDVASISNKSFNPLKEPETMLEHYSIPAFDKAKFPVFEPSTSIKSNKFIVDAECFLISKLNPTTKRVWMPYCLTSNAVCSTEFIVYKAKNKEMTDYLYSVIDSSTFSDYMCSYVTGSTGSRQRTTPSDTLSFELILPSEGDLADYQDIVSPMYTQMKINTIENEKLKSLRDSLLPKLMSGAFDVSTVQL
ncbi:MAG: restriction endonuclease subunit S [Velocimicrobium sp.]